MFKQKNTYSQTTLETLEKKVNVMFKVNNKGTKTTLMRLLYFNFEEVNVCQDNCS